MELESGVLSLYAVFDKNDPTRLTILEIYASRQAYEQHVKSPHFLKYKTGRCTWSDRLSWLTSILFCRS